jgi:hypothetical protein
VAIDPLVPQKRTLMGPRLPCVSFPKADPNHYALYRLFIIARFRAHPDRTWRQCAASWRVARLRAKRRCFRNKRTEEMPLPSDPKVIFLGGLFVLALLAAAYVASEIVLPLVFAIILKLLL